MNRPVNYPFDVIDPENENGNSQKGFKTAKLTVDEWSWDYFSTQTKWFDIDWSDGGRYTDDNPDVDDVIEFLESANQENADRAAGKVKRENAWSAPEPRPVYLGVEHPTYHGCDILVVRQYEPEEFDTEAKRQAVAEDIMDRFNALNGIEDPDITWGRECMAEGFFKRWQAGDVTDKDFLAAADLDKIKEAISNIGDKKAVVEESDVAELLATDFYRRNATVEWLDEDKAADYMVENELDSYENYEGSTADCE